MKGSSRIAGGSNATDGSAPHQVALFKNGQFICGGSLIGLRTVLTAAHCVFQDENSPAKFLVRYGSLKLYEEDGSYRNASVASISRHPQYDDLLTDYDVALLHLSAAITRSPNADIIPLATETPANGSQVLISGFGLMDLDLTAAPAEHLQLAERMVVMDHDQCEEEWSLGGALLISDRILCVASDSQTALPGDSGGPMVFGGRLVGVTSFLVINLDDLTIMDGYSNVVTVRRWIEENMNGGAFGVFGHQATTFLAFSLLLLGRLVQRWWWW